MVIRRVGVDARGRGKGPARPARLEPGFFFNDTATTEIYSLSLHDALPISLAAAIHARHLVVIGGAGGQPAQRERVRGEARRIAGDTAVRGRRSVVDAARRRVIGLPADLRRGLRDRARAHT